MATSNSIDFAVTRLDIITEALELLGALQEGESPNADQITSLSRTLNALIKAWQAKQLNLFAVQTLYLFPQKNKNTYSLSGSTSDHITTAYGSATVTSATASGATTIPTSIDMELQAGDYIGIEVDNNVLFWTTVQTNTVGASVDIDDALTEDVEEGAQVYAYRVKAQRPMKVLEARINTGDAEIPVDVIARRDYNDLTVKTTQGLINQVYFDPQIGTAKLKVWPETDNETNILILEVQRTLHDLDNDTDNPDIPQEWFLALAYNLAVASMPKYGTPQMDGQRLMILAGSYLKDAEDFDVESETSVYIQAAPH